MASIPMKCNPEFETRVRYYLMRHNLLPTPPTNKKEEAVAESKQTVTTTTVPKVTKPKKDIKKNNTVTLQNTVTGETSTYRVEQDFDDFDPEDEEGDEKREQVKEKGSQLTADGPAPFVGDILEHPELLWTEDSWTAEKEALALKRIEEQGQKTSPYWRNHYEQQAGRYWHQFYQRNQDHFYKDRHYIHVVFPELQPNTSFADSQIARSDPPQSHITLLEVGCGVGNAVLPLLEVNPTLHIIAVDFAKSAIDLLNKHITQHCVRDADRFHANVNNIVDDPLPSPPSSLDLVLCMFVLSAMSNEVHLHVFRKLFAMLKPGGKLLMRDYGRFDEAQLRFKKGSKLDDNFYVRQDGTCSYFFSLAEIKSLAEQTGFEVEVNEYILRQYANRQQKKARYRVWLHVKLVKPAFVLLAAAHTTFPSQYGHEAIHLIDKYNYDILYNIRLLRGSEPQHEDIYRDISLQTRNTRATTKVTSR